MLTIDYKRLVVSKTMYLELEPKMESWRTVYASIKDMKDLKTNVEELCDMLAWECKNPNGPRSQIITRLHMRLNAMRGRLEFAELAQHAVK